LVKLVIDEPETPALESYLGASPGVLATSRLAIVEVGRACELANPSPTAAEEADRLVASCLLVAVTSQLLRAARKLTSSTVRSLDAIHLASALRIEADELLVYDRRLLAAAGEQGLQVSTPTA
jgi:uncharacterized protein